jgi:opacity protein-like surface antigen
MKIGWWVLVVFVGLAIHGEAKGQAAVYGQFGVSDLTNLVQTDLLYGATAGVLYQGPLIRGHVIISGDIQGRFMRKSGESLNGVTVGPRLSVPLKRGLAPYGEFMVGFARFNHSSLAISTTDSTFQANAGLIKRLSPHWDASVDYSYAQYDALGGEYNPKTFSAGAIFHFVKR